ncbi:Zinc finger ZZ type protein [Microdochium nivale]|nr:Zinc finger ZZ type protein [Microdochium nivale]
MSSTSSPSAAASNLTRPRVAIAIVSTLSAIVVGYYTYLQATATQPASLSQGSGLHRSNAVRRNRHGQRHEDDTESEVADGERLMATADETLDAGDAQILREANELGDDQNNEEWYTDGVREPRQRSGENIVTLLFRVSEDNARRNAYVHRGCQCNGCGMVPIRGIRYRCANCADFDLCEACESQSLHNKTHVFYKVKIPAPPFGPRQIQPVWYPGDPDTALRQLPRFLLTKWSAETGFERVELDALWEQWTFMANSEWRDDPNGLSLAMDRKTFERCLVPSGGYRHATPNLIHDRMFAFYDTNNDDLIGFEEFLHGVSYRKRKDKLRRTFEGYDIDGDGYVDRRDFLRMFRAYYVLYKQMHRDILEGLDDHMMTTIEAQQLINSRQPLSSLFGREGRVPPAEHSRPLDGKIFHSSGEVRVHDDRGVVHEDTPDVSGRQEILNNLFTRHSNQGMFTESFSSTRQPGPQNGDSRYWSGIINPPQNLVDLSSLISGDYPQIDAILDSVRQEHQDIMDEAQQPSTSSDEDEDQTSDEQQETAETSTGDEARGLDYDNSSSRPLLDPALFTNTLPTDSQLRAQHQAISAQSSRNRLGHERRQRTQARRQLLDRWRRRHFYLDEEEGATPPQGWLHDQDVFAEMDINGEPSKRPESDPSRNVDGPKKIGGPLKNGRRKRTSPVVLEAEKDAGKEILYQVTQQAFNELLDELFKVKEDLAVRAAETREQRAMYRSQLDSIDLQDENSQPARARSPNRSATRPPLTTLSSHPPREQSLGELLQTSGYTVVDSADEERDEDNEQGDEHIHENPRNGSGPSMADFIIETDVLAAIPEAENAEATRTEDRGVPLSLAQSGSTDELADHQHLQDPTMPQFRPNSVAEADNSEHKTSSTTPLSLKSSSGRSSTSRIEGQGLGQGGGPHPETAPDAQIDHNTLVAWRRLDLAEDEARERGGWGRLSYEEFEEIYREHEFADGGRNRLDYLGSWIDFCIP